MAKRTIERKQGFDTIAELKMNGFVFHEEFISKIEGENFKKTEIWDKRRSLLVNIVSENLK